VPSRPLSAVLFDLDGVLVDTDSAILALWRDICAGHGILASDADLTPMVLGCSPEHTVGILLRDLPATARAEVLVYVRDAEPNLRCPPGPGAAELARRLAAAGVPLAVVTSASARRTTRVLSELDIARCITTTVVWGDAPRGKPYPDGYLLAAARLGLPADRCVVFEDSVSGLRAALAAGATCVGVGARHREDLLGNGATAVVATLAEVLVDRTVPVRLIAGDRVMELHGRADGFSTRSS
jgi:HAD superfamily hydrolase (TIGR01509 family)